MGQAPMDADKINALAQAHADLDPKMQSTHKTKYTYNIEDGAGNPRVLKKPPTAQITKMMRSPRLLERATPTSLRDLTV